MSLRGTQRDREAERIPHQYNGSQRLRQRVREGVQLRHERSGREGLRGTESGHIHRLRAAAAVTERGEHPSPGVGGIGETVQ